MKSLSRDNARFSQPADWLLNTLNPQATAGSRSAPAETWRRSGMRSTNRKKPTGVSTPPAKSAATCTSEQRDRMQTGLRILARMIARGHLRRGASGTASAPPPDRGAGD